MAPIAAVPQIVSAVHSATAGGKMQTAQGESIATGIWTLVSLAAFAAIALFIVWIKWGPTWKKTEIDGETQLRTEMWRDIEALKVAKEDTSRRLAAAEGRLISQSVELGQHRFLLKMVSDELDRVQPGNPVAAQARSMIEDMQRMARPMPEELAQVAEAVAKLCKVPMEQEKKT